MAYWVKSHERDDYIYTDDGDKLDYTFKFYAGPFRTITDAEEYLRKGYIDGATILEFE